MPTQNVSFWHVNYFELKAIKTNFISYLTAQNNFDKGPVPGKELLPEIIFLYQKDLSVWHGKHLFTKHLLFSSSC